MTDRPTREEVDECMRMAREETFGADDPTVYMHVLAAEVEALRDDVASLAAVLARIETLPAGWRACAGGYGLEQERGQAHLDCADELERALQGGR